MAYADDIIKELADALRNAQPKLHKMAEEESDDTEAVVRLFTLNDSINVTIEKYKLVKKGDLETAATLKHDATAIPHSSGGTQDLIDLMGDDINSKDTTSKAAGKKTASLEEDLLGLSFQDTSYGAGGGIALGFGNHQAIPGPPLLSSTLTSSTARGPTPDPVTPNYSSLTSTTQPSSSSMNAFAGLDQFNSTTPQWIVQPQPQAQTQALVPDDEDDFAAFSSAVPVSNELPTLKPNEIRISSGKLQIVLEFNQRTALAPDGPIVLRAKFSNGSGEILKDLTFQLAVTKVRINIILPIPRVTRKRKG